ncbi:hypothetical protein BDN70DRAFT_311739 [Pholiota conissans]|uniref:Uncharacterized protein n=1 Tax=Pholiota conissans TaxID=109636 RepID=A0A9P5YS42_9AGAR|nr:hypothetical protein BDN70DRAFT_311739 [Pholiota conissans]
MSCMETSLPNGFAMNIAGRFLSCTPGEALTRSSTYRRYPRGLGRIREMWPRSKKNPSTKTSTVRPIVGSTRSALSRHCLWKYSVQYSKGTEELTILISHVFVDMCTDELVAIMVSRADRHISEISTKKSFVLEVVSHNSRALLFCELITIEHAD